MADSFFHVEDVSVCYNRGKQNEVRSLQGVTVDLHSQEYVIIFGPSGCGKSTLLYSLAALQAPTGGDIFLKGRAFSQMTKKEKLLFHRTGMGIVFQAFFLIPSLTIIDNVCLPRVFMNEGKKKRREEGMKLLERFDIAAQAFKYPSELSGGQKQRVSIARALINNPDIIFADEPVGNLDSVSARNVLEILKELNEVDKKTIILVTHDAHHLTYGDRILHMKDGKLVREEANTNKHSPDDAGESKKKEETGRSIEGEDLSPELRMLARSFSGLFREQASNLLVPFKVKQLIFHILSEITEEQMTETECFVREFLSKSMTLEKLEGALDADLTSGGAGWNKQRAHSFTGRVRELAFQAEALKDDLSKEKTSESLATYVEKKFTLSFEKEQHIRLSACLAQRLENTIDRKQLADLLDSAWRNGGMGLYKTTAERIAREVELILLLKY